MVELDNFAVKIQQQKYETKNRRRTMSELDNFAVKIQQQKDETKSRAMRKIKDGDVDGFAVAIQPKIWSEKVDEERWVGWIALP